MRIRPVHVAVVALAAFGALASASGADAAATSAAEQPVSRFVAYQACQAGAWQWTAENAKVGTTVGGFRHTYRAQDVWREGGDWMVLLGGTRGEAATPGNDVVDCLVAGTNAKPKIVDYTWPR